MFCFGRMFRVGCAIRCRATVLCQRLDAKEASIGLLTAPSVQVPAAYANDAIIFNRNKDDTTYLYRNEEAHCGGCGRANT